MPAPFALRASLWLWLIAALLATHFGTLARLPLGALPVLMVALAALACFATIRLASLRGWLAAIDVRALVLLHVTRAASYYLLALADRDAMPAAFAAPTAWAEMVLAGAALLLAFVPLPAAIARHAFAIWNVAGLGHLLLATATAIRIGLADPAPFRLFTVLPLSLFPTFLLPLLLTTHFLLWQRLKRPDAPASGEE